MLVHLIQQANVSTFCLPDHLVARINARTLARSKLRKMKRKMQINGKIMHNEKRMKEKIKKCTVFK
jgi:hypothetical protein